MTRRILVLQDFCLTQRFTDDVVLAMAARMGGLGRDVAITAFAGFDAQALTEAKARKVQGHTLGYDAALPTWLETLREDTTAQVTAFAERSRSQGIPCDTIVTDTDPAGTLLTLAEGCDWAAIPRDASATHWNEQAGDRFGRDDALWHNFLLHTTVPTLIGPRTPVTRAARETGKILVGYDGSDGASRITHSLAGLGLPAMAPVHVLSVVDEGDPILPLAEQVCSLLRAHGSAVTFERQDTGEHPAEAILARVTALEPLCLAIGVFGHRSWQECIFGSVTRRLLDHCSCATLVQR